MSTNDWSFGAGYCKIKTARQKKRLLKEDFDKHLIHLHRLQDRLYEQRRKLPLIPLETPYQKGWARSYVLREDVARSRYAAFYQTLLEKINTIVYHHDKRFKVSKKKRRKKIQADIPQTLVEFHEWDWNSSRNKLTEAERALFYLRETRGNHTTKGRARVIKYVFADPWRYVLRVKPHMITHAQMIDEVLEQEIRRLDNHIENHNLRHKIEKLVDGSCYSPVRKYAYNQKLFKQPTYKILEACAEE